MIEQSDREVKEEEKDTEFYLKNDSSQGTNSRDDFSAVNLRKIYQNSKYARSIWPANSIKLYSRYILKKKGGNIID